jgi:ribonucleoside-diphosphate reductase alpha chain
MNPAETATAATQNGTHTESYTAQRPQGPRAPGLSFSRYFTRPGISPFDEITWELRDAIIQD